MSTIDDLRREMIAERCNIAHLYSELLQIAPTSRKLVNAAHDWTLKHIESLVNDISVNLPQRKPLENHYTEYFLSPTMDLQELNDLITSLEDSLHKHSSLGTKIEQVAKGVA